jgi:hypothetical protein
MINLNLISLIYLFFRLAPLLIVCTFTLQVILNSDVRSFMFLLGLCLTLIVIGGLEKVSGRFRVNYDIIQPNVDMVPISIPIYGFIISFIMYIIGIHKIWAQNIPILTIFPLLAVSDFIWNYQNIILFGFSLLILLISVGIGCGWAVLSNKYLSGFETWSGIRNKNLCKNAKTNYKCTTVKKT